MILHPTNSQHIDFNDWLAQCPVRWFKLDSDDDQRSYQFIIDMITMTFQVTDIDFDIDCSYEEMTIEDRQELFDEVVGAYWEACDEDDLIEEITAATGWCINSIDYRIILK